MKNVIFILLSLIIVSSCNNNLENEAKRQKPTSAQLLSKMDRNNDGKLSENEADGPIKRDFGIIDRDNDGYLTLDELDNAGKNSERKGSKQSDSDTDLSGNIDSTVKVVEVNTEYFISDNLIDEIQLQEFTLHGISTPCYVLKTNSLATEHQMGPWCPRHIEDGMEKAGIWFKDGSVYDVSGHFIATLDKFYSDDQWKLYREDGTIKVTETKEGCLAAAKPDVEEAYHNHCVECLPEYFKDQVITFVIPAKPVYLNTTQSLARGGIGLAFNGVKYDPPAPTHAIIAAHTIAPLDNHGGHVNPHGGYHYHAVTGSTKEIDQPDTHAPMIGYAIDGFGIYALMDKNGNKATDLDECNGHYDEIRGYHYHAGEPGDNQILKCLHGLPGFIEVEE